MKIRTCIVLFSAALLTFALSANAAQATPEAAAEDPIVKELHIKQRLYCDQICSTMAFDGYVKLINNKKNYQFDGYLSANCGTSGDIEVYKNGLTIDGKDWFPADGKIGDVGCGKLSGRVPFIYTGVWNPQDKSVMMQLRFHRLIYSDVWSDEVYVDMLPEVIPPEGPPSGSPVASPEGGFSIVPSDRKTDCITAQSATGASGYPTSTAQAISDCQNISSASKQWEAINGDKGQLNFRHPATDKCLGTGGGDRIEITSCRADTSTSHEVMLFSTDQGSSVQVAIKDSSEDTCSYLSRHGFDLVITTKMESCNPKADPKRYFDLIPITPASS